MKDLEIKDVDRAEDYFVSVAFEEDGEWKEIYLNEDKSAVYDDRLLLNYELGDFGVVSSDHKEDVTFSGEEVQEMDTKEFVNTVYREIERDITDQYVEDNLDSLITEEDRKEQETTVDLSFRAGLE